MNTNVELKEEISFDEFKAWMNGLVRGRGQALPSLEDWRVIKQMMDKVVPDKETIIQHTPIYTPEPYEKYQQPLTPWCDTQHVPSYGSYTGNGTYGSTKLTTSSGGPIPTSNLTITGSNNLKVSQSPGKVK